jgi:hypothetical protein
MVDPIKAQLRDSPRLGIVPCATTDVALELLLAVPGDEIVAQPLVSIVGEFPDFAWNGLSGG